MSDALSLAPLPVAVERHLSASSLGRRVRVYADATLREPNAERSARVMANDEARPLRPLRLAQSDAAEALACLLDTSPPSAAVWLSQMQAVIVETFQGDDERTTTATVGLISVRTAMEKGGTESVAKAIGAFDELLYGLCLSRTMEGAYRG